MTKDHPSEPDETADGQHDVYDFGSFRLDVRQKVLLLEGRPVSLTPKAFETLKVLVLNSGRLLEKGELMAAIWPDSFVEEATLAQNVFTLRRVLAESQDGAVHIETVPKRGYRFVCPVVQRAAEHDAWIHRLSVSSTQSRIAVLPFLTLNSGEDAEYLGLAIADALITRLSNVRGIIVRPTSAIYRYKDVDVQAAAAAAEMKVDLLVEGKALIIRDRVRVTVQLSDAARIAPLWADQFDERLDDLFAVLDRISDRVVQALTQGLTQAGKKLLMKDWTASPDAYQEYVKGRYQLNKWNEEGFARSIRCFERAIELDPGYALPYTGIADSHIALAYYDYGSPVQSMPRAKLAAQKALELDDTLGEALLSWAGVCFFYDWDWPAAERSFRRAIEANPNYPAARQVYGLFLLSMTRFDEAYDRLKEASELDPASLLINTTLGFPRYFAGRLDEAQRTYEQVLDLDPKFGLARTALADVFVQKMMYEEAISEYKRAVTIFENSVTLASLAYAYAVSGQREPALAILEKLKGMSGRRYVSGVSIAAIYAGLGQKDDAFGWLERSYETRASRMIHLNVNPVFDSIRGDKRFEDLIKRIGLPPGRMAQGG